MKKCWGFLLVAVLMLAWVMPVSATSGAVTAGVQPAYVVSRVGEQISVAVVVDVSQVAVPDNRLGSYSITLKWNPAVMSYANHSDPLPGWMSVVNTRDVARGKLWLTGANAYGATGRVTLLTVTFDAAKAGATVLDLNVTAMAAAGTFNSLMPILTVVDGRVQVKRK